MVETSIIIPAYNEEDIIANTLDSIRRCIDDYEIIVVNDGSRDNTAKQAKEGADKLITLKDNGGKGRALNEGLKHAEGSIIVFLDADIGLSAGEVIKLVEPIRKDEADFTVAVFPKAKKKGGFGIVKSLAYNGVRIKTGYRTRCALSGQRAFKREILANYQVDEGFGVEIGMMIDLLKQGYRFKEVPVNMNHRETGRNLEGFIHRGKQFMDILRVLLKKKESRGL